MAERHSSYGAGTWFRARRFVRFREILLLGGAAGARIKVLDLGGHAGYWRTFEGLWRDLPIDVTIVNRFDRRPEWSDFTYRQGDACDLGDFGEGEFDVVHSNSVIEHVGDWTRMCAFSREVARVGKRYFVQTPNFWFPIEPHFRLPLVHWLPDHLRYRLVTARSCGFVKRAPSVAAAMNEIDHIRLLDSRQLQALFPEAAIERETLLGMTKSLIAIRR